MSRRISAVTLPDFIPLIKSSRIFNKIIMFKFYYMLTFFTVCIFSHMGLLILYFSRFSSINTFSIFFLFLVSCTVGMHILFDVLFHFPLKKSQYSEIHLHNWFLSLSFYLPINSYVARYLFFIVSEQISRHVLTLANFVKLVYRILARTLRNSTQTSRRDVHQHTNVYKSHYTQRCQFSPQNTSVWDTVLPRYRD